MTSSHNWSGKVILGEFKFSITGGHEAIYRQA